MSLRQISLRRPLVSLCYFLERVHITPACLAAALFHAPYIIQWSYRLPHQETRADFIIVLAPPAGIFRLYAVSYSTHQ
jgi:hypothetical protein